MEQQKGGQCEQGRKREEARMGRWADIVGVAYARKASTILVSKPLLQEEALS